jgi:protein TonB
LSVALAAALFAHAGIAGALHFREEASATAVDDGAAELVIVREEPPPPPPVAEPLAPPEPPPVVEKVIAPAPPREEPALEPPASEAAQAGEVLVQDEDAEEEEEETDEDDDNTIVTGTASSYAGGVTAVGGTSALAVHGTVSSGGVPGGSGTAIAAPPKPPVKDLSRGAWLEGNTSWDCDFPGEADRDRVNHAAVEMTVMVAPSGKAYAINILDDPGHGFARMATGCALKHKFLPARDPLGNNIWARTRPFHIGFHR